MTTCVAGTLIDITRGKLFTTGLILSYILHCMLMIKKHQIFFYHRLFVGMISMPFIQMYLRRVPGIPVFCCWWHQFHGEWLYEQPLFFSVSLLQDTGQTWSKIKKKLSNFTVCTCSWVAQLLCEILYAVIAPGRFILTEESVNRTDLWNYHSSW